MPRPLSHALLGALSVAAAAAAGLSPAAGPALAQGLRATASAHAAIIDSADLKGVTQVAPSRPGVARAQLQVTVRAEPIPGDAMARRELIVVFD
jgi:hypothetical protein